MKKTILFLGIFLLIFSLKSRSQEIHSLDSFENAFLQQLSYYPQEKIHVQTDKPIYVSGETIWFRVHLVDALLLKQANASRYVYVELINPISTVVNRIMLHPDSTGAFHGNINLDEALPEGNYTLRAYTRFMQNQGEDYFFKKPIYIIDPLSSDISPEINYHFEDDNIRAEIQFTSKNEQKKVIPEQCKLFIEGTKNDDGKNLSIDKESAHYSFRQKEINNQRVFLLKTLYKGRYHNRFFTIPQPVDSFNVSFFPEGGHAPLQSTIKVAFKALKRNGLHENVKGIVYDDTGKECARFESSHLGMGQFMMYYMPGRTYYAICTNEQNKSKRFPLPNPEQKSISLKLLWDKNNLRLALSKSVGEEFPDSMHLLVHIRCAVLYSEPWNANQGYLLFAKDFFPAGIIHFLLIDKDKNILSERLAFSLQNSTFANTEIEPNKQKYQSREKVNITIKVTDENNVPLEGNFSLSVVDKRDVPVDTTSNIISTLLLTSELKGYIESPASYLKKDDRKATAALDVLMMTQGWRRYDIHNIVKGNLQKDLKYPVESTRELSGKVTGVFSALKEGGISLIAIKDSVIGTLFTNPDEEGRFAFRGVDYPDSTRYIIQALTKRETHNAFIELDSTESFPSVNILSPTASKKDYYKDTYLHKTNEKYIAENGMRVINLAEIEVRAARTPQTKTESPYYSVSSSFVLTTETIEKANFLTVYELLRRLPGITISGGEVLYRQAVPLLILDNLPIENFDYSRLNVNDINDAFVSPATSVMPIFGSRAANGAIVINTKKGFVEQNTLNKNIEVITPIGYQQHVEFYSPVYETKEQQKIKTPDLRSTIYWNPSVITDGTGTVGLSFYSADPSSEYGFILEGISNLGHIISSSNESITIK